MSAGPGENDDVETLAVEVDTTIAAAEARIASEGMRES